MASSAVEIVVTLEFAGGCEILFGNQKRHEVRLPEHSTIRNAVIHIKDKMISSQNYDAFLQNDFIRPGILVLVNDTDWELLDGPEYELQDRDRLTFISTLHGG